MKQGKLKECLDRIKGHSEKLEDGLGGLELLHEQAEGMVSELNELCPDKLGAHQRRFVVLLDLARITMDHLRDQSRFLHETATEIGTNDFRDLTGV